MATKKRVRRVSKVLASASTYIDPLDCDSTVSYKVIDGSMHLWGSVQVADCSRKIEWYFPNRANSLPKIDKAIAALQEFRDAFAAAQKSKKSRSRTRKAK